MSWQLLGEHTGVFLSKSLWLLMPLFAAADSILPESFPLGSLGAYAVLGWYLWFDTAKGRPNREAKHDAAMQSLSLAHAASMKELRDQHAVMMAEMTNKFLEDLKSDREHYERAVARIELSCENERKAYLMAMERLTKANIVNPGLGS